MTRAIVGKSLDLIAPHLATFFSSLAAFIFIGVFLAASLFLFFWVARFFARDVADVRPLFAHEYVFRVAEGSVAAIVQAKRSKLVQENGKPEKPQSSRSSETGGSGG